MAWKAFIFPLAVSHRRCFRVETDAFLSRCCCKTNIFAARTFVEECTLIPKGVPPRPSLATVFPVIHNSRRFSLPLPYLAQTLNSCLSYPVPYICMKRVSRRP